MDLLAPFSAPFMPTGGRGPFQGREPSGSRKDEGKFFYGPAKEFTRADGERVLSREKIFGFAKEAGDEPVKVDDSFLKSHMIVMLRPVL